MKQHTFALSLASACFLAQGCTTTLKVVRVTPGNEATVEGFRYSLPATFLKVCPGAAGAVDVTEEYLPDPLNTYAISGHSRLAKHDLNVEIEKGLLKKVEWNADSAAVAAKSVESAGALAKTALETDAKSKETLAGEQKKKADKNEADVEAARKAVAAALTELQSAEAALELLKSETPKDDGAILKARIDVAKAQRKYDAAVAEYNLLVDRATSDASSSGNAPGASADSTRKAQGCVLFRVVNPERTNSAQKAEATPRYSLIQATTQDQFATSVKLEAPPPEPPLLELYLPAGNGTISPKGPLHQLTFTVRATDAIFAFEPPQLVSADGNDITEAYPPRVLANSQTTATVTLAEATPEGRYRVKLPVRRRKGQEPNDLFVSISVERPK